MEPARPAVLSRGAIRQRLKMADELTTWRGRSLVPLDENEPLKAGDRIVIRFKWFLGGGGTYLKAAQLAEIDKKLADRSDFRIREYVDQSEYLDCEIEILAGASQADAVDPSSGITQASLVVSTGVVITAVAISVAITSVVFSLLKYKQYKLVESGVLPAPKSAVGEVASGFKILTYGAVAFVALLIVRQFMRR